MGIPRRLLPLGAVAALAACSSGKTPGEGGAAGASAKAQEHVACAVGDAQAFTQDCTIEHARRDGVEYLVIRHPNGGFRRFEVLKDGGLAAADGAEQAQVSRNGAVLEVAVGSDRYRIPTTPAVPASGAAASQAPAGQTGDVAKP